MDLHRELPWARSISSEEFSLFMMCQEWSTSANLEAHLSSAHARRFNELVLSQRMLVTEPSFSLFSAPLSASDIAELGAEAAAAAAAAAAGSEAMERLQDGHEHGADLGDSGSAAATPKLGRTNSRSSLLQQSGTMTLKR
mmetsp:Transcript_77599/g.175448  ORF Transcript_77599/g.175448 Transcript_77599/m.175448 type:complete len:140 (-) Transcript_77599:146-565(-)